MNRETNTSEILNELSNELLDWTKLSDVEHKIDDVGIYLSDTDYSRLLGDLEKRKEVSVLLEKLQDTNKNKRNLASESIINLLSEYGALASSHPDYDNLINEHNRNKKAEWINELDICLRQLKEVFERDLENFDAREVESLFRRLEYLPEEIRKGKYKEIYQLQVAADKINRIFKTRREIEDAIRRGNYFKAREKLEVLKIENDNACAYFESEIKKNETRSQGVSITAITQGNNLTLVQHLFRAEQSATIVRDFRLAYNLMMHIYTIGDDEEDRNRAEEKAKEHLRSFLERMAEDVTTKIRSANNAFQSGDFESAEKDLDSAEESGKAPPKLAGSIEEYLGDRDLSDLPAELGLAQSISTLRSEIKKKRETRQELNAYYQIAIKGYQTGTLESIEKALNQIELIKERDNEYPGVDILRDQLNQMKSVLEDEQRELVLDQFGKAVDRGIVLLAEKELKELKKLNIAKEEIDQKNSQLQALKENQVKADAHRQNALNLFKTAKDEVSNADKNTIFYEISQWENFSKRIGIISRTKFEINNFFNSIFPRLSTLIIELENCLAQRNIKEMVGLVDQIEKLPERYLRRPSEALAKCLLLISEKKEQDADYSGALSVLFKAQAYGEAARDALLITSINERIQEITKKNKDLQNIATTRLAIHQAELAHDFALVLKILQENDIILSDPELQSIKANAELECDREDYNNFISSANTELIKTPKNLQAALALANKAKERKESSEAITLINNINDLISKEEIQLAEADKLTNEENIPAVLNLVEKWPQISYFSRKLSIKKQEIESKYGNWDNEQNLLWQNAQEKAKSLVDNYENYEEAESALKNATSPFYAPSDLYSKLDSLVYLPKRNSEATRDLLQISDDLESRGDIFGATNQLNGVSEVNPQLVKNEVEKRRKILQDRSKLLREIKDALDSAELNLTNFVNILTKDHHNDMGKLESVVKQKQIALEKARTLEISYKNLKDGKLTDENNEEISEKVDDQQELLFDSGILIKRLKKFDDQYNAINKIYNWVAKLDEVIKDDKYKESLIRAKQLYQEIPADLIGLLTCVQNTSDWIKQRELVKTELDKTNRGNFPVWPFSGINKHLADLAKLSGKDPSTKVSASEREKERALKIEERLLERNKKVGVYSVVFWVLLFLFLSGLGRGAVGVYQVINPPPTSTPTLTPTITPTSTPTPITPTPTITPSLTPTPTPTPLPLSGELIGTVKVRQFPALDSPLVNPGYLTPGNEVNILRYCKQPAPDDKRIWLLIPIADHYGWIPLRDGNLVLVSIEKYDKDPEIVLRSDLLVKCPGLYEAVPGLPTPNPHW